MIQIKPKIDYSGKCMRCGGKTQPRRLLWQGIHVCVETACLKCSTDFIEDLPVGHALIYPFVIDQETQKLAGRQVAQKWFGKPLLKSLQRPDSRKVKMTIIKKRPAKKAVILNCLDYLYGHSLLKLLNAQKLLGNNQGLGVVVIIPKFLEWLVIDGLAEIWVVDLPLKRTQNYYPNLERQIEKETERFEELYLSKAYSHPLGIDITKFTGIRTHRFDEKKYRVTFIWREDRPWVSSDFTIYGLRKLNLLDPLIWWQNLKIRLLFYLAKRRLPEARYTVAGIGKKTRFPSWVDDVRFVKPNAKKERKLCKIYSESLVVIGIHGSNMLLPSAHAGMVVDLVPDIRLGNVAQDILYRERESDPRIISLKYRFLSVSTPILALSRTIVSMISQKGVMFENFLAQKK